MATQSLLNYLTLPLPVLPTAGEQFGPNTKNRAYSADDINELSDWNDFSYASIMQDQDLNRALVTGRIDVENMPVPDSPVLDESTFSNYFFSLVTGRVRKALRAGFQQLGNTTLTRVTFDSGSAAIYIDDYKPDQAIHDATVPLRTGRNLGPGDLKVSWKWCWAFRNSPRKTRAWEFKQVLAQLNHYLKQHHAQYGFICTNREFVAVKRLDKNGNLALSQPIAWTAQGPGRMTPMLGLWYLAMLCANPDESYLD